MAKRTTNNNNKVVIRQWKVVKKTYFQLQIMDIGEIIEGGDLSDNPCFEEIEPIIKETPSTENPNAEGEKTEEPEEPTAPEGEQE